MNLINVPLLVGLCDLVSSLSYPNPRKCYSSPDDYRYHTLNFDTSTQSVWFEVKARNDAHVLLKAGTREFEIVLGGWGNTQSAIRDRPQGHDMVTYPGSAVNENWFTAYEITWYGSEIVVYKEGNAIMTMGYRHLLEGSEITSVAVSTGWGSDGRWCYDEKVYPNECFCNNGWAGTGSDCHYDGEHFCTACHEGYYLTDHDTCERRWKPEPICSTISCASWSLRPKTCFLKGVADSIRVLYQTSILGKCVEGWSYELEYSRDELTVSKGCQAVFSYCYH